MKPFVDWVPVKAETKRLHMVAPAPWVRQITEWRRQQPDIPNISEAIRRLVDAIGLKGES